MKYPREYATIQWVGRIAPTVFSERCDETVYVIPCSSFRSVDGYIDFVNSYIDLAVDCREDGEVKDYMLMLKSYFIKLYSKNTSYKENYNYEVYQEEVSCLMDSLVAEEVRNYKGVFCRFGEVDKSRQELVVYGYENYKDEVEKPINIKEFIREALLHELDNIDLEKERTAVSIGDGKNSHNMSVYGCHIEVVHTINTLLRVLRYMQRARTEDGRMYSYDKQVVEQRIKMAKVMISRVGTVI